MTAGVYQCKYFALAEVGEDKWKVELCLSVRMRWQPWEVGDHSGKRLLWVLWLLDGEKTNRFLRGMSPEGGERVLTAKEWYSHCL